MQKFWISRQYVKKADEDLFSEYIGSHVPIFIKKVCSSCNAELEIDHCGDENSDGTFAKSCEHYAYYGQVYGQRIIEDDITINYTILKHRSNKIDGCKCIKCGLFSDMSVPNQKDGTFKCYSCRSTAW